MELSIITRDLRYVAEAGSGTFAVLIGVLFFPTNLSRVPSIGWQFLWNWFFGPYLLWKIHMIRDIYLWRLQTILAVVSG